MTRDEAKQLLPIIQAYAEGKEIQRMNFAEDKWADANFESNFLCCPSAYRIKPEPLECWAVVDSENYVRRAYSDRDIAAGFANDYDWRVIRMREV